MMFGKKNEYILILGGWAMAFVSPALYLCYVYVTEETGYDLYDLYDTWKMFLPFFLMFLFHHYLLVPLSEKKRIITYVLGVSAIIGIYTWYQVAFDPDRPKIVRDFGKMEKHEFDMAPPLPDREFDNHDMGRHHGFHDPHPMDGFKPKHFLLRPPVLGRIVIALLMIGMDLGIVSMIKSSRTRNRLLALEKEKLAMELDYLKYQINPHFFMNTLNNIHALVDVDQEKAKRTIIDLSGLMRYVLYDSGEELVPMEKEMRFIQLYISLMRLRYSSNVDIQVNIPDDMSDVKIPPLLLICFVENAFKHGVSNRQQSFINIYVTIDEARENFSFLCVNSLLEHSSVKDVEAHGVGIENARKRLNLIYGDNYILRIRENIDRTFEVWLQIPISSQESDV